MFGGDEQSFYTAGIQRHEINHQMTLNYGMCNFHKICLTQSSNYFFKPKLSLVQFCCCTKNRD